MGKATTCQVAKYHQPRPVRFVWHHIQPQEAGGQTVPENLVQLCDSCHYTVHHLLYQLYKTGELPVEAPYKARDLAREGYARCVAAGTQAKIPNEG